MLKIRIVRPVSGLEPEGLKSGQEQLKAERSKSKLENLDEMLLANYADPESDGADEEDRV